MPYRSLSKLSSSRKKKPHHGNEMASSAGSNKLVLYTGCDEVYTDVLTMPKEIQTRVYHTVASALSSSFFTSSTTATVFNSIQFDFSSWFSNTAVLSVFDQYKLNRVELILRPRVDRAVAATTNTGTLATCIDYDDANAPTAFSQVSERPSAILSRGDQGQRRCFTPRMAVGAYGGTTFTQFMNPASQWIDSGSTLAKHYGAKFAWTATDSVYVIDMDVRTWWSFRQRL